MRLEYFSYLIELSKHTSMSEASKALHITTPALSIALKKLEDEFSTELIYTDNKGTRLTKKGEVLVENSQKFLAFLSDFKNSTHLTIPQPYTINLLAAYGARDDFMPSLRKQLNENMPYLFLNTTYSTSESLLSEFSANNYELGLLYNTVINDTKTCIIPDDIEFIPLFSSCLYCIAHKDSPIANYKKISLNTLARLRIPIIISGAQAHSMIDLLKHFPAIKNTDYTESYLALLKQLSNNLGVTLSSTSLSSNNKIPNTVAKDCVFIKISDNISFQLGFIKKKNLLSPYIDDFINYTISFIQNYSSSHK